MSPEDVAAYVRERLESRLLAVEIGHGRPTLTVAVDAWRQAVRLCKVDDRLDCELFDFLTAVDLRDEGFAVLLSLYSVRHGHHVQLRAVAEGGRDAPRMPSIADTYAGANWHERETFDMFGIVFDGHPGLEPRILTTEGFEGWPLRKEFLLTTREVKPWPGLKEPKDPEEEVVESGERVPADSGPGAEEKARLAKEKAERAKRKAAEMRARKAAERAAARGEEAPEQSTPSEHADRSGAKVRSQAAGMETGGPEGQPGQRSGAPGVEAEGRHGGAEQQSGTRPAAETPGTGTPPGTTGDPDEPGEGTPPGAVEGPATPPAAGAPGEPPAGEADASRPPEGQEQSVRQEPRAGEDATSDPAADDDDERQE